MDVQSALAWIGGAGLGIGVIVAATYGLFRWLGQKWLENKFAEGLEAFKHEKQRELESLKSQLSSRLNRIQILNQHEFEVLPTLFRKLNEAHGAVADFTSPLQSFADVDRLKEEELEDILEEQNFKQHEKQDVKAAAPRSQIYRKILFWKRLNQAHEPYKEFNNYLITNSIFFDAQLRTKLECVRDMMWEALMEAKHENEFPDPRPDRWEKRELLRKNGRPCVDEIRDEVQTRLGSLTEVVAGGSSV